MSDLQRVIKYCAMGFAVFLAFSIISGIFAAIFSLTTGFSGISSGKTIDYQKTFENVKSLDIQLGAGTFELKTGQSDQIEVTANHVSENFKADKSLNGKLTIKSKFSFWGLFESDKNKKAKVTIYIPADFSADSVKIDAGAGNMYVDSLTTNRLDINAGTGNIDGGNITANEVSLDGGVGNITLDNIAFYDVDIDCGVGNVNLEGSMLGNNKLECGVGNVYLQLTGSVNDYDVKVDKGLGSVTINNQKYSDHEWSNNGAPNSLDIDGGVGDLDISFE